MINVQSRIFKKSIKTYNRVIASIEMRDILKEKINKPVEQRLQDSDKIRDIVNFQDHFFKKNKRFNFLGLINIHCCKEDNQNYLVDGQHRFSAATKLTEMGYSPVLDFELVEVETLDQLRENYAMINKNTELPDFPNNIDKNIPEEVAQYFFTLFPSIWKSGKKPTRPFLNKNHFQEALGFLTEKLTVAGIDVDVEDLKMLIIDKNEKMKKWPVSSYVKEIRKLKKWPNYKEKAEEKGFYLGMYPATSEPYTYGWVKDIVKENTGEILLKAVKQRKKNKKSIPAPIREQVWRKYMGNVSQGMCYCCRLVELKQLTNYQCGHILSENKGGTLDIYNLRPICASCNLSMGAKHMREYIQMYYPCNLVMFDDNMPTTDTGISTDVVINNVREVPKAAEIVKQVKKIKKIKKQKQKQKQKWI